MARGGGFPGGELDEFVDMLGATAATAAVFQAELCLELARRDETGTPGFPNVRLGNSLAEAQIHDVLLLRL